MSETEEASVYGVMASWLTPLCLFLFINLLIGTIAITSRFTKTSKRQHQLLRSPSLLERFASFSLHKHEESATSLDNVVNPVQSLDRLDQLHNVVDPVESLDAGKLDRVDSSSLDWVRSFNFNLSKVDNIERLNPVQDFDRVPSSSLLGHKPGLPRLNRMASASLLDRVRSFSLDFNKVEIEGSDPIQQQLSCAPSILQRLKSSLSFDKSVSVKEAEPESEAEVTGGEELVEEREEEEGVDAKADDFINRFRQQLRLQRLDSIMRYTDMLKRN